MRHLFSHPPLGPLDTRHSAPVRPPCSESWRPPVPSPAPHEPSSGNPEAPGVLGPPVACSPGLVIAVFVLPAQGPPGSAPSGHPCWPWCGVARGRWSQRVPCRRGGPPGPTGKIGAQSSGAVGAPFGGRYSGDMGCWPSCRRIAAPGAGPGLWCCSTRAWRAGPGAAGSELRPPAARLERQSSRSCRLSQAPRGGARGEGSSQIPCWPGPALLGSSSTGRGCPTGGGLRMA